MVEKALVIETVLAPVRFYDIVYYVSCVVTFAFGSSLCSLCCGYSIQYKCNDVDSSKLVLVVSGSWRSGIRCAIKWTCKSSLW